MVAKDLMLSSILCSKSFFSREEMGALGRTDDQLGPHFQFKSILKPHIKISSFEGNCFLKKTFC